MNKRLTLATLRLAFGILVFITLIAQIRYLQQHNALDLFDFFSYFTILSNIFAAIMLIIGSFYLFSKRKPTHSEDVIRSASVLYMTVTGIVFALLLSGQNLGLLLPWVNDVLHKLMPVIVIADWLYQPSRTKLQVKQSLLLLVFPLAYLGYSLIRGPIAGWYPYLFLNPSKSGGYAGVAAYCVGILVLFFVLSWLLRVSGNKLKRHVN
jgi:hypothetical protein